MLTCSAELRIKQSNGVDVFEYIDLVPVESREQIMHLVGTRPYEIMSIESNVLGSYCEGIVELYHAVQRLKSLIQDDETLLVARVYFDHVDDDMDDLAQILEEEDYLAFPYCDDAEQLGDSLINNGIVIFNQLDTLCASLSKEDKQLYEAIVQELLRYIDYGSVGSTYLWHHVGGFSRIEVPSIYGYVFFPDKGE